MFLNTIYIDILHYSLSQIHYLVVAAFLLFSSCRANERTTEKATNSVVPLGVRSDTLPSNEIRAIYQDRTGTLWIGTDGNGICRYDGKSFMLFTEKDGVSSNSIRCIYEDANGYLWFETADGLTRYDGTSFTAMKEDNGILPKTVYARTAEARSGNAWHSYTGAVSSYHWFPAYGGVNRYDGTTFTYFPLPDAPNEKQFTVIPPSSILNGYTGYCTLVDREGNLWVGTELRGVCKYDGKTFTWFNEKHLGGAAVRAIYQDKAGNIWMGNNGGGLFRYDGKTFRNITEENHLSNTAFLSGTVVKDEPHTLARVWSITEDHNNNLWIGTIDAGAWKYDGNTLTNYTTTDGLNSNHICTIYRDRTGKLWFSTVSNGIAIFDGRSFTDFSKAH